MHMADALISPAVGGTMWAASAALTAYSAKRVRESLDDRKVPLMGVLGAFIFAAQMINFTIPGTGSSGHLGGGMVLAILLGPEAAFLTLASVLTVQALFFADGGLLALGCNIFNLGFFPCFVAYPLVYRRIAGACPGPRRILLGSMAASILALQMGAFGVVLETTFSGISELPFAAFTILMLPIHLAIGIVEGLATAAVVTYVWKARPELVESLSRPTPGTTDQPSAADGRPGTASTEQAVRSGALGPVPMKGVLAALLALAALTGGALSWFASAHPDGLEWSMSRTSGKEELNEPETGPHALLGRLQEKTAVLPDYGFRASDEAETREEPPPADEPWPAVSAGTSVSGLVGALVTMLLVGLIGLSLRRYHRRA
ncbi:MAG: energy-coupling factor ABC transporter permease [bacterium]